MKSQPFPEPPPLPEAHFSSLIRVGYQHCLFKIFFGEEGGLQQDDRLKIGVAMTPSFLKAMIGHLSQELEAYESRYGKVPNYYAEPEG
jgi:hypothetical protein